MKRWYLSFAGEEGWRGCAHIKAPSADAAITESWRLGINPGGEVLAWEIDPSIAVSEEWFNRLMNRAELEKIGEVHIFDDGLSIRSLPPSSKIVWAEHNRLP